MNEREERTFKKWDVEKKKIFSFSRTKQNTEGYLSIFKKRTRWRVRDHDRIWTDQGLSCLYCVWLPDWRDCCCFGLQSLSRRRQRNVFFFLSFVFFFFGPEKNLFNETKRRALTILTFFFSCRKRNRRRSKKKKKRENLVPLLLFFFF